MIRVTRTGQIRADAMPVARAVVPKRKRGADLGPYTVPSDQRAGELTVRQVPQVLASRSDLSAAQLAAHAPIVRTEPPYREYQTGDPRRSRSRFDRDWHGSWNTSRTRNPKRTKPADPSHPSADPTTT